MSQCNLIGLPCLLVGPNIHSSYQPSRSFYSRGYCCCEGEDFQTVALGNDSGVLEVKVCTAVPTTTTTAFTEGHLDKVGGVEVVSGLPGQQPDGQVDEASCQ